MKKEILEQSGPMKVIFNYEDVFYSFYYDDISGCIHRARDYALNYVYSGEMILDNGKEPAITILPCIRKHTTANVIAVYF